MGRSSDGRAKDGSSNWRLATPVPVPMGAVPVPTGLVPVGAVPVPTGAVPVDFLVVPVPMGAVPLGALVGVDVGGFLVVVLMVVGVGRLCHGQQVQRADQPHWSGVMAQRARHIPDGRQRQRRKAKRRQASGQADGREAQRGQTEGREVEAGQVELRVGLCDSLCDGLRDSLWGPLLERSSVDEGERADESDGVLHGDGLLVKEKMSEMERRAKSCFGGRRLVS